jgi:RND family efflux transporter MFP subunit
MNKWIGAGLAWGVAAMAVAADFPATLQWSQRVELSPRVSGIVRQVEVNVGDSVKKGQLLLSLDADLYEAKAAEGRALVARGHEELADAKRELGRIQELYDRTVIATSELDQAKLRHARAKAQLDAAQAQLKVGQKNLSDSRLTAPFDAVVVARLAEPGQHAAVGLQPQPLLVLARAGEMVARFKVPTDRISTLKAGQSATVVLGKQEYPARLKMSSLEPVKDGTAYEAEAAFDVKEMVRAGMPATVRLP